MFVYLCADIFSVVLFTVGKCNSIRPVDCFWYSIRVEKEVLMKAYVAPALELVVLNVEDVLSVSGIQTVASGDIKTIKWSDET